MDVVKSDKPIKISSKWHYDNQILTKFKADKYTFNVVTSDKDSSWSPEMEFSNVGSDKALLTQNKQIEFKAYALNRMNKEGLISPELKRSGKFRFGGLFSFDWTSAYDTYGPRQKNIPELKLDKNLTYDEAYDLVVDYFKKEKVLK